MEPIKSTEDATPTSVVVIGSKAALQGLSNPTVQPPRIPPPVIVEIQNRIQLSRLIDGYLFPQESGPEFAGVRQFLASCAKLEWNRPRGCCECFPAQVVQGFNSMDEEMFEMTGPYETSCLCAWSIRNTLRPLSYQGTTILSFSWKPVLCPLCSCGSELTTIEVFVPDRAEPIGKLEYMSARFSDETVTITNYITNEMFTASLARSSNPNCPSMVIKNESGTTVARSGVHSARIYRGTTTYMGINVVFPDIGMSTTTKAIMMAFGTVWQMDHQQSNKRCSWTAFFISLLICIGIFLFRHRGI